VKRLVSATCWLAWGLLAGCQCSEKRDLPPPSTPLPLAHEGHADEAKPAVAPLSGCDGFLVDADVEKACGLASGTVHGAIDHKQACLKRFKHPAHEGSSIVLSVRPEDDADRARRRFKKSVGKAKKQADFTKVDGIGAQAHTFTKTKGKGKKVRSVQAIDFVADRFVVQLRTLSPVGGKSLCEGKKLPDLAKLVVARFGGAGAGAMPAPSAPAPGEAAEKVAPAEAKADDKAAAKSEPAAPKPAAH
jgi:hypothetical protein